MASSSESLIDFENEKDLSNLSTPSSSQKSLLPASMSNLTVIDATPSHEVQMRVKRDETLPGGSKQTNEHSYFSYNNKVTSNDADDENATSKLLNELRQVRDTEQRILAKLESHFDSEKGRQGGGDSLYEGPGQQFSGFGRLFQDDNLRVQNEQCWRPSTNPSWNMHTNERVCGFSAPSSGGHGCVDTMTQRNVMANYPVEGNLNVNQTPNINTTSNTSAINRHFNPSINFKAKKAPTYDGTGSWQDFLVQFEMVAQMKDGMRGSEPLNWQRV